MHTESKSAEKERLQTRTKPLPSHLTRGNVDGRSLGRNRNLCGDQGVQTKAAGKRHPPFRTQRASEAW